jgi:large subunit ribosomal protein L7e
VKKILQLFRLRQIHNGVFVRVNAATIKMLRLIEPFIAYGYPNLKSTRDIIYKRGFGKVTGSRIPISCNTVVEAGLGKTVMVDSSMLNNFAYLQCQLISSISTFFAN